MSSLPGMIDLEQALEVMSRHKWQLSLEELNRREIRGLFHEFKRLLLNNAVEAYFSVPSSMPHTSDNWLRVTPEQILNCFQIVMDTKQKLLGVQVEQFPERSAALRVSVSTLKSALTAEHESFLGLPIEDRRAKFKEFLVGEMKQDRRHKDGRDHYKNLARDKFGLMTEKEFRPILDTACTETGRKWNKGGRIPH